jgi:2-polyprenyl-6-methoxyphenol hydroxylase-like FAD-dependent oxidoreductase
VIGAGIAGLAAARIVSERYDTVTLLDRDSLPDGPGRAEPRRGVPQGEHAHALLAVGHAALERQFPGLTDELVAAGAQWLDAARDATVWQLDGYRVRAATGVMVVNVSRPTLETLVRRRVAALPNVTVRPGTAVSGLAGEPRSRVTGVVLDGADPLSTQPLPADLVVDASGRGSRSDRWLADLGFPAPEVSSVTVRVGYATRTFRRPTGPLPSAPVVLAAGTPPDQKRFGVLFPIEGDRWLVTIGGFHGDHPPTDPAGYLAFAESLPDPTIGRLLRTAEPLTDAVSYQYPMSRRRRFERLRDVPAGYVATGDALCSFNPVYGHGMTVAAVEAELLGERLDRYGAPTPAMVKAFYREATRLVDVAWEMARQADFSYRDTVGARPRGLAVSNWYLRRVLLATHVSPDVLRAVVRVQHLLDPGSTLLRPTVVVKALRAARQARRAIADR